MGKLAQLVLHPLELRAAIQFKFFTYPAFPRNISTESATLIRCNELLDITSRSFAMVIRELNPGLRVAIMVFYLVLRALDTVEDDMSIPLEIKVPILKTFHEKLDTHDWTFDGNDPKEKDRCVLVEFDVILAEYHQLRPVYQEVIKDITKQMGEGMAESVLRETSLEGVPTVEDYDKYCYYVAGLVGVGLTRLFVALRFANDKIGLDENFHLTNSMGLFLQKANIIRDFREDLDDGRSFWPKEIWGKYAKEFKDFTLPENEPKALECVSEMVLNTLSHVKDVLIYLSLVEETSAYQFCVIPQVMAIANSEMCFQNPRIFHEHIKLRKGQTCDLILRSRTYKGCIDIFREYIRKIHHKCPVEDVNYLKIGIKCGELEQFIESLFIEEYMPKGASIPEHDQVYNDVKHKIELDAEVEPKIKREIRNGNLILISLVLMVIGICM